MLERFTELEGVALLGFERCVGSRTLKLLTRQMLSGRFAFKRRNHLQLLLREIAYTLKQILLIFRSLGRQLWHHFGVLGDQFGINLAVDFGGIPGETPAATWQKPNQRSHPRNTFWSNCPAQPTAQLLAQSFPAAAQSIFRRRLGLSQFT